MTIYFLPVKRKPSESLDSGYNRRHKSLIFQKTTPMSSEPKPWAGRFTEATDAFVEAFTASVDFDKRLAPYDIQGSIAHAAMLKRIGVLSEEE